MGLAEYLLGAKNPFASWANDHQNYLAALGGGLAQGQNIQSGLSAGLAAVPQAKLLDDKALEQRKAETKIAAQTDAFKSWLSTKRPDLVPLLDTGVSPAELFNQAMAPAKTGPAPIEINGQLVDPATGKVIGDYRDPNAAQSQNPYMNAGDGKFFNWQTGQYTADLNAAPDTPTAPAGYKFQPDGNLGFIPGGPADPSTAGKTTEATRRNQQLAKVIIPEVQNLEKNWAALSDVKNQIAGNGIAAGITGGLTSPEFQQAKNSLRTIIASYLYSVSGATANPGEVENQAEILTPKFGESAQSVQDKLARVKTMVQAVVDAAQGTPIDVGNGAAPAGGVDDILAKYGL